MNHIKKFIFIFLNDVKVSWFLLDGIILFFVDGLSLDLFGIDILV